MIKKRDSKGFTLLELAICILVIGIISAAATPKVLSMFEDADAEMFRALGGEVEVALAQGFNRGKTYTELTTNGAGYLDDIIGFAENSQGGNLSTTYTGPGVFTATVTAGSSRSVTYGITTDARVTITAASGFNHFSAVGGDLVRN